MKLRLFLPVLCIAALFLVIPSALASTDDGLVAHYELNGNADDSSGNGMHATVVGGAVPTVDRCGNPAGAYQFDGIDDGIWTPVWGNFTPLSFSVWFNADTTSGERSIVDSDVSGHYGHSLILGYWNGDGELDVQYHNGPIPSNVDGPGNTGFYPNAGEWYHVVVNYSSTIDVYVNGTMIASWPYSPPDLDSRDFRLGRHNAWDPQWFEGKIDDVRFYNRILSSTEVEELANPLACGIPIVIDVKPGSDPNCFNNDGHGVIPVAVLTTDAFDAASIDPFSVSLDGAQARVKGKSGNVGSLEDVDSDGDLDLVIQIEDQDGVYQQADTVATLTGLTYDDILVVGSDNICIVP
jgi:hypothetical protein